MPIISGGGGGSGGLPLTGGTLTGQLEVAPTSGLTALAVKLDPAESTATLLDVTLVEEANWETRVNAVDHGSNNVDVDMSVFANGTGIATLGAFEDSGVGELLYASNAGLIVRTRAGTVGNILLVRVGNTNLLTVDQTGAVAATGALSAGAGLSVTGAGAISDTLNIGNVPSGDPHVAGQVYQIAGTLHVSTG